MSLNVPLSSFHSRPSQDPKTEIYIWQRMLYFRSWLQDARVCQVGSRDGRYLRYAATFASEAIGLESVPQWVSEATARYPEAEFLFSDMVNEPFDGDLLFVFETLEESMEPTAVLASLARASGSIILTATNSAHRGSSEELVPESCARWTASEFKTMVDAAFTGRTVRYLSQKAEWPGRVTPGFDKDALYTIAIIGDLALPTWPRLGLAMPTVNAERVRSAVLGFSRFYPGAVQFAVVANGPSIEHLEALRSLRDDLPEIIELIESEENLGFARGCNLGLDYLWQEGWFDLFGVTNDDVLPAIDCLPEMVVAFDELRASGQKPGVIGPVTNVIHGPQQVEIGAYNSFEEMIDLSNKWHWAHHSCGTATDRVRGLLMLIDPDCLSEVGGFDPLFGLGNWEDDDHNKRCRLAGYSLWIADGAFLHHEGSATFKQIGLNYDSNIHRNLELLCEKWGVAQIEDFFKADVAEGSRPALYIPLTAKTASSGHRVKIANEVVDLVHQATDIEFCSFVYETIKSRPRSKRLAILEAIAA